MTPITPQQYYTAGYKQALKDLVISKPDEYA
jgi:hypothetical protein